jgi:AcrR family transcriptional regulator
MPKSEPGAPEMVRAAIDLYVDNPRNFTISQLARSLKCERALIYKHFPNKSALLRGFYQRAFDQYLESCSQTPEYEQFTLEEKLSHLIYTHLELFQEEREFVEETFNALIFQASPKSGFQQHVENRIAEFLQQSEGDVAILGGKNVAEFLTKETFFLIKYWLKDESVSAEQTVELADKLIRFASEALQLQLVSRGLELGRAMLEKNVLRLKPEGLNRVALTFLRRYT